jgi:hypothetical protein
MVVFAAVGVRNMLALRFLALGWPPLSDNVAKSTRPVTASLNFFAPNFLESDFNCT